MKKIIPVVVAVIATLFSQALRAEDFPSRSITFNNPFGPGSASDTLCRIIGDQLGATLNNRLSLRIARAPTAQWRRSTSLTRRRTVTTF
jgi:tripartite-type tricarboxylate transporter receptor subunit TctC